MPETPQETKSVPKMHNAFDFSKVNDDEDELLSEKNLKAERSRTIRRRWIFGISLLLIISIAAAGTYYYFNLRGTPPVTYQFQAATQGDLKLTASATGAIQADSYSANFTNTGKITTISVKVGDTVTQNQYLGRITLTDGSGSVEDLYAPHAGVVTAINGHIGDTISSSGATSGSGNAFIQITDLTVLTIVANVNEADISKVALDNPVQFTVSTYGEQTFAGKVKAISPIGKAENGVVNYPVTIEVDKSKLGDANLLPNMTANVTITTASRSNVVLIPNKAVSFANEAPVRGLISFEQVNQATTQAQQLADNLKKGGKDPDKNHYTKGFVLVQVNNKWVAKAVVLGLTDGTSYELIAGDLSPNERLLVGVQNGSNAEQPPQLPDGGPGGGFPGGGPPGGGPGQ